MFITSSFQPYSRPFIIIFTVGCGTIGLIANLFTYSGYSLMVNYVSNYISKYSFLGIAAWRFFYFCLGGILAKKIDLIKEKRFSGIC